jgi:hypothetical protein
MRSRSNLRTRPTAFQLGRIAAWTVIIALLVNVVAIMPIMLGMAVADGATMASGCPMQGMADRSDPGHRPFDHSHCLVCTGGIGAALLAANIAPPSATLVTTAPLRELPAPFPSRGLRTAYISRAPPVLA